MASTSDDQWSAAVIAEPTEQGLFRAVLVLAWAAEGEARDVVFPLEGEYSDRLAAEEAGKDALAAMALDPRT